MHYPRLETAHPMQLMVDPMLRDESTELSSKPSMPRCEGTLEEVPLLSITPSLVSCVRVPLCA